jgi:DNA processing protein
VRTLPVSADGQAIALACSTLALRGNAGLKPLTGAQWHEVSRALHNADLRPRDLLGMSSDEIRGQLGLRPSEADRLSALLSRGGQLAFEVEHLASLGIWILTRADEAYPARLKARLRGTAPPLLFGAGPQAALQQRAVAVVGSRDVSDDGLEFARSFGERCAAQGWAVASGAARGVDTAAMKGALEAGGQSLAISVDPLERLIARRELRMAIADEMLTLATPFHPSAKWQVGNAMRRNRLIYAIAEAAVVVASSSEKGGTRAGAVENLEAGWVPLHVRDDGSVGNRRLLAEGGWPLPPRLAEGFDIAGLLVPPRPSLLDDLREAEVRGVATASAAGNAAATATEPGAESPAKASGPRLEAERLELAAESEPPHTAFAAVWPLLARLLATPMSERELADAAELEPKQARVWLTLAVDRGLAEVGGRPKRYSIAMHRGQLTIGGALEDGQETARD